MKLTNLLVQKIGADKMLHFLFPAWLVAMVGMFFDTDTVAVSFVFITILAMLKETFMDDYCDLNDMAASFLGGGITFLIHAIFTS